LKNLFHRIAKNIKGFTLVEMITAFAILGLTAGAVGGFVITGVRSYKKNNTVAAAQQEVQLGMNRIDALVKEASLGISYNVESTDGTSHFVTSDGEAGVSEPKYKALYSFTWNTERNQVICKIIRWDASDGDVEYLEANVADTDNEVASALDLSDLTGWDLLASDIENFSFDLSQVTLKGLVTYSLRAVKDRDEYESTNNVSLRNDALLNPESVGNLYEQAEAVVQTVITGLKLSSALGTVVKGGNVQLSTRVLGEGYPSQLIHRWVVEKVLKSDGTGMDGVTGADGKVVPADAANAVYEVIYDSAPAGGTDAESFSASVNSSTKLLSLADDSDATLLRVTATVNSGEETFTAVIYISVKEITAFAIQPERDANGQLAFLDDYMNVKLKSYEQNYPASDTETDVVPEVHLFAGNEIPMQSIMTGTNLNESDRKVSWNIIEKSNENVLITISSEGLVMAGQYTQSGSVLVMAYPYLDPSKECYYRFNVESLADDEDTALRITGMDSMNRGASLQLGLSLNGVDVADLTEYDWSAKVSGSGSANVTGNPVSITGGGLLTVSTSLAFEYAFSVTVTATLRSMPDITASATLRVPKVEIKMINPQLAGKIGTIISANDLRCEVTGIEKAQVAWTVASATNPNTYSTALPNGTFITASQDTKSAVLNISSSEPSSLTYFRVKAAIKDYPSLYAVSLISLKDVRFEVAHNAPKTGLVRGNSCTLTARFTKGGEGISTKTTRWTLLGVTDSTSKEVTSDGVTLSGEWGTSVTLSLSSDYWLSSDVLTITMKAELSGLVATGEIVISNENNTTINASATTVKRGSYSKLTTTPSWTGYDVTWSILKVTGGSTGTNGLTLSDSISNPGSSQTCKGQTAYLHVASDAYFVDEDVLVTVQVQIEGIKIEKTLTIKALKITMRSAEQSNATAQQVNRGKKEVHLYLDIKEGDDTYSYGGTKWSWTTTGGKITGTSPSIRKIGDNTQAYLTIPADCSVDATGVTSLSVSATITGKDKTITKSMTFNIPKVELVPSTATVSRGGSQGFSFTGFDPDATTALWTIKNVENNISTGLTLSSSNADTTTFNAASNYYYTVNSVGLDVEGKVVLQNNTGTVLATKTARVTIPGESGGNLQISGKTEIDSFESTTLTASLVQVDRDINNVEWSILNAPAGLSLSTAKGASTTVQFGTNYDDSVVGRVVHIKAKLEGLEAGFDLTIGAAYSVTVTPGSTQVKRGGSVTFTADTKYPGGNITWTAVKVINGVSSSISGTVSNKKKNFTVSIPETFDTSNSANDYIQVTVKVPGGTATSTKVTIPQITLKYKQSDGKWNSYTVTVEGYDDAVLKSSSSMSFGLSKTSSSSSIPSGQPCGMKYSASNKFTFLLDPASSNGVTDCGPIYAHAGIGGLVAHSSSMMIIGLPTDGTVSIATYSYGYDSGQNKAYYKETLYNFCVYLMASAKDPSGVIYLCTRGEKYYHATLNPRVVKDENYLWFANYTDPSTKKTTWLFVDWDEDNGVIYSKPKTISTSQSCGDIYEVTFDTPNAKSNKLETLLPALMKMYTKENNGTQKLN